MQKIWILLPVHNRRTITSRFVGCLTRQTHSNFHLVLIDDGSADGTADMVKSSVTNVTVLTGRGDWWWAGSLQRGFNWLKSRSQSRPEDIVLIINDDTQFEPDFLARGVFLLDMNEKSLILAQCYSKQSGKIFDAGRHVNWSTFTFSQPQSPDQINCLSTRGLFLRLSDFFAVGGFFPRVLPHYLSDYEFTIRANHKGFALKTDPSLKLWVDEQATGYRERFSDPLREGIVKLFSKKCVRNPIARTMFIALACPWRWKLSNWLRVWYRAGKEIIQLLMNRRVADKG